MEGNVRSDGIMQNIERGCVHASGEVCIARAVNAQWLQITGPSYHCMIQLCMPLGCGFHCIPSLVHILYYAHTSLPLTRIGAYGNLKKKHRQIPNRESRWPNNFPDNTSLTIPKFDFLTTDSQRYDRVKSAP